MKKTKPRDGEATKTTVLDAAEKLFAEKGFAGTSIRKISNECGISDGLILHHFKTKEELYRQVRERLADRYGRELSENLKFSDDLSEMMRETMETAYRYFRENELHRRISLWSYLEGKTDFAEKEMGITKKMIEMTEVAQETGYLRDDLDAIFFPVIVKGAVDYWIRWREMFAKATDVGNDDSELDKKFFDQMIRLLKKEK